MFSKQAVCISTAAGAGMRSAIKDMADSTFFWGCASTYKLGVAVMETRWDMVKPKIKRKIEKKTASLAKKISSRAGRVKPAIKTRAFFGVMSMVQKNGFNETDMNYWKAKGWTNGKKPWKK